MTFEAVWRPQWPQNLIFIVGLKMMEVLYLLLTTSQFLQNSSKNLQKMSKNPQKYKSPISSMSAAGLLGPNLV